MNRDSSTKKFLIRYIGVYDWDELYTFLVTWFLKRKYDYSEDTFKDKGSVSKREYELKMIGDKKLDDFTKIEVKIVPHIWDSVKVEIVEDGQKKILDKGRVEISLSGKAYYDYQERWNKTPFHRKLFDLYGKFIGKRLGVLVEDPLYYEVEGLQKELTALLNKR